MYWWPGNVHQGWLKHTFQWTNRTGWCWMQVAKSWNAASGYTCLQSESLTLPSSPHTTVSWVLSMLLRWMNLMWLAATTCTKPKCRSPWKCLTKFVSLNSLNLPPDCEEQTLWWQGIYLIYEQNRFAENETEAEVFATDRLLPELHREERLWRVLCFHFQIISAAVSPSLQSRTHPSVPGRQRESYFSHETCAIDTNSLRVVFDEVAEVLFQNRLRASGL